MDISTITASAVAVGVLIESPLAVLQLRDLTTTRKANTLLSLVPRFRLEGGEEYLSACRLIMKNNF